MTPASKLIAQGHRLTFAAEVAKTDDALRLELAALLIAAEDEAHLNVDVMESLLRLAGLGTQARQRVAAARGAGVEAFNRFMFEEAGFHGERQEYYAPRNSFLHQVLERRTGLPITLSIVYLEVGRRAGLLVEGIGLPGHFIVRASEQEQLETTLVDPFYGKTLTAEDCQARLDEIYGGQVTLDSSHLRAVTTREILVRLLMNLKSIYINAQLYRRALAVVERILLLTPSAVGEHRDRGALLAQLDRLPEAIAETQTYLNLSSHSEDQEQVREQLQTLQRKQAMRN
ncbi:MAG TPA: transglutaminase-like domain-containing protein [Pyrinomonadaceae bacterium]|jgi:regulator of sirC expression with transglutaminase-like and TPR domain|nr:transglutaminase-like domain-containing protein [Pyrinomonadaceae bacterium]